MPYVKQQTDFSGEAPGECQIIFLALFSSLLLL